MSAEAARLPSLIAGLDESWLDLVQEEALEPDLPICDPHHHLWEREGHSYLLTGFLKDAAAGHRIVSTVFAECGAFYRADGPAEVRPVGEAEFVAGVGAMSDSGRYGATRVAAAFTGFADLTLGAGAEAVLAALVAAGGGRFRGVRHAAAWDPATRRFARASPVSAGSASPSTPGSTIRSWATCSISRVRFRIGRSC